jgi:glycosyltransferase involved in cell wall biosynthesis
MKVLLVGEFSSLHKNLKEGLVELGHEVVIAADSCGWMDIKPDVNFTSPRGGLLGKIESYIVNPLKALPSLTGFDVVQFMSPLVLHSKTLPLVKRFYRHLVRNNGKSFLLSAGDDCYFAKIANVELAYSPWPDAEKHDGFDPSMWHNEKVVQWNDELVGMVNGVIPILYEYAYGYRARKVKNLIPTIPIPMNLKAIKFHDNIVGDKVRFFHGLNRYGFKGTSYIEKAFETVAKRYPNDVQCTIAGKMPLEQYLKLISEVNVSLDQTNSYSYAMNAIYSLAMGHVVMSGCEPECLAEFLVASSPVINIVPDSSQIVEQMERVLENRKRITEWGREGRRYAEQLHDHVAVAQRYLDAWGAA